MNQPFVELETPLLRSSEHHFENYGWGSISSYWEVEWPAHIGGRPWGHKDHRNIHGSSESCFQPSTAGSRLEPKAGDVGTRRAHP